MFADKDIQNVEVVVQVGGGHGDELAVPGRDGVLRCPGQQFVRLIGDQRGSYQQLWCDGRLGSVEDFGGGCWVTTDQPVQQVVRVSWHA